MSSKGFIGMMLALIFFIPVAYGFSMDFSGGDGVNSFSDVLAIDTIAEDRLDIYSLARGSALEQHASGNGYLHKSFSANNHKGERAQITADVLGAGGWEYYQPTIYTDATSASVSGFTLTATDANSIKCAALATDRKGDKARASVEVYQGSIYNYRADAFAYSDGVGVLQSFDRAIGDRIAITEKASNRKAYTSISTNVEEGYIDLYSNLGATFAHPYGLETVGYFDFAAGNRITSESSVYKTCGYRSNVKLDVKGSENQDGSVDRYLSAAGMDLDFGAYGLDFGLKTGAAQLLYGAQGNVISLSSSASNQGDTSNAKMVVVGSEGQDGSIKGYFSAAGDDFDLSADELDLGLSAGGLDFDFSADGLDSNMKTGAAQLLYEAKCNVISLSSSASSKSDKSNANMKVEGSESQDSSIKGYFSAAGTDFDLSADRLGFGLSADGMGFDYSVEGMDFSINTGATQLLYGAQGDLIDLSASSSNRERDLSSTSMQIRGTENQPGLVGYYWDLTASCPKSVFAGYSFYSAAGDSISLLASSSNKKRDEAEASINIVGDSYLSNCVSSSHSNAQAASVINELSENGVLTLAGGEIEISASASNAVRDKATVSTVLQEGSIVGSLSNGANADSSAKMAIASQEANGVSGSLMQLDATAIRRAREMKNLNEELIDPLSVSFGQYASVIAAVPDVSQVLIP